MNTIIDEFKKSETEKMKTLKQWQESRKPFDEFAHAGDIVSEEIVIYFLNIVPPRTNRANCVQCGEPYGERYGETIYTTFILEDKSWKYLGERFKR